MKTAKIISIIGHPIFQPTWMMTILLLSGLTRFTPGNDMTFLTVTFLTTFLIPGLIIVMMKKWNIVGSFEMENRNDRPVPLFVLILFLYTTLRFFNKIQVFSIFSFYLTTVIIATILAIIVTFFWKISLHALGWGTFVACLFVMTTASARVYLPYFIASIVIAGIVAAARLKMKAHDEAQIYAGFALGFATVIVMYLILLF